MTAGHPNRRFVYYMYAYQVLRGCPGLRGRSDDT